jgi:HEAT repeat protein
LIGIAAAPVSALGHARDSVKRAIVRRRLEAIAAGRNTEIAIDFDEPHVDVARVLEDVARPMERDSSEIGRLIASFRNTGTADRIVANLESPSARQRASAARAVGALRMYEAGSGVAALLAAPERRVVEAAARALGRIGGTPSATALVAAIQRHGVTRRLVSELARSAPDYFVEAALEEPQRPAVRPALAIAAGLRHRRTAAPQLMALVRTGSRRERMIACRALGWIGERTAAPAIVDALTDSNWKVRMSAAKALGGLHAASARDAVRSLYADRNPRVRLAALQAVRRIDRASTTAGGPAIGA